MVTFDRTISVFSSGFKAITAAASLRSAGTKVKALGSASPKVKAIAAGGLLAFVTGVTAPALVATHTDASPATQTVAAHTTPANGSTPANGTTTPAKGSTSAKGSSAPVAPTSNQLHPVGNQGSQVSFNLTTDQMRNAQKIIQAGQSMGLPPRAWVIALATSMQETKLHNYGNLGGSNDHDSLGLFQQRPSSGWGTPDQIQNPTHSAKAFYQALKQVPNWQKMPLTDAAQAVQVSAFGDRYAQWEAHAGDVVNAFYGHGPLAKIANHVM